MIHAYSAAMSLLVAQTLGAPGYAVWAVGWSVVVFRVVRQRASRSPVGEATGPETKQ